MSHDQSSEITPSRLRQIREASGLSQSKFWAAITVKQASGHQYENGQRMPPPVARLVLLHYVAGIPTDAPVSVLAGLGAQAQADRTLRLAETLMAPPQ